jgi:hypothetical protein
VLDFPRKCRIFNLFCSLVLLPLLSRINALNNKTFHGYRCQKLSHFVKREKKGFFYKNGKIFTQGPSFSPSLAELSRKELATLRGSS